VNILLRQEQATAMDDTVASGKGSPIEWKRDGFFGDQENTVVNDKRGKCRMFLDGCAVVG
jgi:hypothetical protein